MILFQHRKDCDIWDWGQAHLIFYAVQSWRWEWSIDRYDSVTGKFSQWRIFLPTMTISFLVQQRSNYGTR